MKNSIDMKHILLIATGGTIASKDTPEGLVPSVSPEELLAEVPEIGSVCSVDAIRPFDLDSTNIYSKHWLELARIIRSKYEGYDGFVITHGTDTMAYTAAALSYLVQNSPKPIVLTGSQHSVNLRDTDARTNLADAFFFCADDKACNVNIVFDGKIIAGTRAKKTRTQSYNAFSSIDFPELGFLRDGKPVYYFREEKPASPLFFEKLEERVFVLKMTPGVNADVFDYFDTHCEGLIIESFGSGGLPHYENDAFFSRLKYFLSLGKTAVLTTQVEREGSALDKYEVGRRLHACGNVLEARNMTLEATLAKLMWLLGNFRDTVSEKFSTPVRFDIL